MKKQGGEVPILFEGYIGPMMRGEGDELPVSAFKGMEDGHAIRWARPRTKKRGIAVIIPQWQPENCIQCARCSYVCPHATIQAILLDEREAANAPADYVTLKAAGKAWKTIGSASRKSAGLYGCRQIARMYAPRQKSPCDEACRAGNRSPERQLGILI